MTEPPEAPEGTLELQLASDLHLEFAPPELQFEDILEPIAPVLALLGDIVPVTTETGRTTFQELLAWCASRWQHVLFVPGNHEYYGRGSETRCVEWCDEWMEEACVAAGCVFLEKRSVTIQGVRILGTTLWSQIPDYALREVQERMNDYETVYVEDGLGGSAQLSPVLTNQWCAHNQVWLAEQLKHCEHSAVVLTHHAPTMSGCYPPEQGPSRLRHAYCSSLEHLFHKVQVWAYGHTHYNNCREINGTRLYSNQLGDPFTSPEKQSEMRYDRRLVIEAAAQHQHLKGSVQSDAHPGDAEFSRDLEGMV